MKVKVVRTFSDKLTYKMYAVGEIIDLPDGRASDAVKKGLVESVEAKEVKTETAVKEPKRTVKKPAVRKSAKKATKKEV